MAMDIMNDVDIDFLLSSLPGHVYLLDVNNRFLACNAQQAESLGVNDKNNLIGKSLSDFQKGENLEHIFNVNESVISNRTSCQVEEKFTTLDGKELTYLSNKSPLLNHKGDVIGILGISLDITNLKKREQAQEAVTNRIEITLENIAAEFPGHVYWKDLNGIYLGCNDNQAKSLGFEKGTDVVGKTDFELPWSKETAELFSRNDKKVIQNNESIEVEEESIIGNKKYIMLSQKKPLKDKFGDIIGVLGISIDISDKKVAEKLKLEKLTLEKESAAEKARQEAQVRALHEQIKLLRRQASTIAHELRTPLGSLTHSATALEMIAEKESDPKLQTKLKQIQGIIQSETNNANLFIDIIMGNVKDLEKVATEPFNILNCIYEAIERFPHEGDSKELITVTSTDDFVVNANKELLIHVLFNLIKNAVYFIHSAGKGEVTIWTELGKDFNKLHFKDTGTGMASSKTKLIFKEFYSDTGIGTGVGLYFCKRVMLAMGGDITCSARKGKYTHFTMMFPAIKTQSNHNDK